MSLSTSKTLRKLRTLQARRRTLLRLLLGSGELAVGTVSWVHRKCGRSGCHCARGLGHRQLHFLFADAQGRRRCKLVRRADEARLEQASERYRAFRDALRDLVAIQKRERAVLMELMRTRGLTYD